MQLVVPGWCDRERPTLGFLGWPHEGSDSSRAGLVPSGEPGNLLLEGSVQRHRVGEPGSDDLAGKCRGEALGELEPVDAIGGDPRRQVDLLGNGSVDQGGDVGGGRRPIQGDSEIIDGGDSRAKVTGEAGQPEVGSPPGKGPPTGVASLACDDRRRRGGRPRVRLPEFGELIGGPLADLHVRVAAGEDLAYPACEHGAERLAAAGPAGHARRVGRLDLDDPAGPVDMDHGPAAACEYEYVGAAGGQPGGAGCERFVGYDADLVAAVTDAEHRGGSEDREQLHEVLLPEGVLGGGADAEHSAVVGEEPLAGQVVDDGGQVLGGGRAEDERLAEPLGPGRAADAGFLEGQGEELLGGDVERQERRADRLDIAFAPAQQHRRRPERASSLVARRSALRLLPARRPVRPRR